MYSNVTVNAPTSNQQRAWKTKLQTLALLNELENKVYDLNRFEELEEAECVSVFQLITEIKQILG
jgi:hypothetical protein